VGEAARVRYAAELLQKDRARRFGELLYESHESWRRLYQASTPEANLAVAAARRSRALGARATGVGGEVVVLTTRRSAKPVELAIRVAFARRYKREPEIATLSAGQGMRLERVARRS
jgi:galactokinase